MLGSLLELLAQGQELVVDPGDRRMLAAEPRIERRLPAELHLVKSVDPPPQITVHDVEAGRFFDKFIDTEIPQGVNAALERLDLLLRLEEHILTFVQELLLAGLGLTIPRTVTGAEIEDTVLLGQVHETGT